MRRAVAALAGLLVSTPVTAAGQIPGPLLPAGDMEAGFVYHEIDREVYFGDDADQFTQGSYAFAFRYGLTGSATFWAELSADAGPFDDSDAIFYTVGGGLMTDVWAQGRFRATTSVYYGETLGRGRDQSGSKWWEQTLEWNLLAEVRLGETGSRASAWLGPSLSSFEAQYQSPPVSEQGESEDLLGLVFGGRYTVWKHVVLQAGANWVGGGLQSHAMLGYHF